MKMRMKISNAYLGMVAEDIAECYGFDSDEMDNQNEEALMKLGLYEMLSKRNLQLIDFKYLNDESRADYEIYGNVSDVKAHLVKEVGVDEDIEMVLDFGWFVCD